MEANDNPKLLNRIEAARFLGVTVRQLRNWTNSNFVPCIKYTDKVVRYRLEELATWQESKTVSVPGIAHPSVQRKKAEAETKSERMMDIAKRELETKHGMKRNIVKPKEKK